MSFDDRSGKELILPRANKDLQAIARENIELSAKRNMSLDASLRLSLNATADLAIQAGPAGSASLTLSPLGTITLQGVAITLQGAVSIQRPLTLSAPPIIKPPLPKP